MSETSTQARSERSIQEIEQDIEQTRARLGASVEELADRAAAQVRPVSLALVGAVAVAMVVVGVVLWRRRR